MKSVTKVETLCNRRLKCNIHQFEYHIQYGKSCPIHHDRFYMSYNVFFSMWRRKEKESSLGTAMAPSGVRCVSCGFFGKNVIHVLSTALSSPWCSFYVLCMSSWLLRRPFLFSFLGSPRFCTFS